MPSIGDTFLSRYRITAELGAGGMGEVYLAEDGELGRRVAIKFLPRGYGTDAALVRRFEREVKAAGALNHPNIITIHDAGSHQGRPFLVMEHVDGETLADVIARNDLSIGRALDITIQICEGLGAAHEAGVTHRDIKPDNILVDRKGRVRILDFGLAKLTGATALTATETTVGTASYMSPEQARGAEVDQRTDLFSLGVVLYEMITGQRPFGGDHPAAVTYAIVNEEAQPLRRYNSHATDGLENVLSKLLAKNRDERYPNAAALLVDLKRERGSASSSSRSRPNDLSQAPRHWRWQVIVALALLVAAIAIVVRMLPEREAESRRSVSFTIPQKLSFHATSHPLAISSTGTLAWIGHGSPGETPLIRSRSLDNPEARSLPGTEGAENVFWSPDGKWIGYGQDGVIKIIDAVASGPPRVLVEESTFGPPSWGPDGTILYTPMRSAATDSTDRSLSEASWLHAVNAEGGTPRNFTTPAAAEGVRGYIHPVFLPDGRHFLCVGFVRGEEATGAELYIGSLDGDSVRHIAGVHSRAQFMNGRLYYADQGYLVARPFDPQTATFEGDPVTLGALSGAQSTRTGNAVFAANAGVVAWLDRGVNPRAIWFDRSGNEVGRLDVPATIRGVAISPDGERIAADIDDAGRAGDIWVYDLKRGVSEPLVASPADEASPVWSPDGDRIAYSSDETGGPSVWTIAADGSGTPVQLPGSVTGAAYPSDWSRDGSTIAFVETAVEARMQIRFVPSRGNSVSRLFAEGPGPRWGAKFSPDGQWVVFASGELGTPEIFLAPRSDGGARRRVSISGGNVPFWGRDGREILYVAGKGSYPIRENVFYRVAFAGDPLSIGRPERLFALEPSLELGFGDVSSDGERFLCIVSDPREAWSNIHVLVDE